MYYCGGCDIAHEEKDCPLCNAQKEIDRLNKEIEDLNNRE